MGGEYHTDELFMHVHNKRSKSGVSYTIDMTGFLLHRGACTNTTKSNHTIMSEPATVLLLKMLQLEINIWTSKLPQSLIIPVSSANAVVHPGTVMVHGVHTPVALSTVLCSHYPHCLARVTDVEDWVVHVTIVSPCCWITDLCACVCVCVHVCTCACVCLHVCAFLCACVHL